MAPERDVAQGPAPLAGRSVVLGVSGSIGAYKAAEICSLLVRAGATVDVAMTAAATEFVGPRTFGGLTGRRPFVDPFAGDAAGEPHVELGRRADLVLLAPATADLLARLAAGRAADMVTLTALATRAPLLIAPAMDTVMWEAPATRRNHAQLLADGVAFAGPVTGRLASGRSGAGRLAPPEAIVGQVRRLLGVRHGDLAGRRVVVTAGGTREALDPVRYLGNRSTGKMGYALARAARDRGAAVVLISSAALPAPDLLGLEPEATGVRLVAVETALQMQEQLQEHTRGADCLVMAAAVADYRPADPAAQKWKRRGAAPPTVALVENPDLVAGIAGPPAGVRVKVAFAAETEDLLRNAERKLQQKGARLLVANDVTAADAGFGTDTNRCTILDDRGGREELPLLTKEQVAHRLYDRVAALLNDPSPPAGDAR